MNTVCLVGRIVRPVEVIDTKSANQLLYNTLAIKRPFKSENGEDTDFIPFVAWGKRATLLEKYCDKGDRIGLCGRMQSRQYKNKEDQTVYVVELVVDHIEFLTPKKQNHQDLHAATGSTAQLQAEEV